MAEFDLTDDGAPGAYSDDNPELAELEPTALDDLEAELTAEIAADPIRLEVTGRPGIVAFYRRDVTGAELERWRKQSKRGKKEVDPVHLAGLLVVGTLERLERGGNLIADPDADGYPLTFSSPYMQRIQDAPTAVEAARKFYGTDGYLSAQAEAILDGAGWGSDALEADPI